MAAPGSSQGGVDVMSDNSVVVLDSSSYEVVVASTDTSEESCLVLENSDSTLKVTQCKAEGSIEVPHCRDWQDFLDGKMKHVKTEVGETSKMDVFASSPKEEARVDNLKENNVDNKAKIIEDALNIENISEPLSSSSTSKDKETTFSERQRGWENKSYELEKNDSLDVTQECLLEQNITRLDSGVEGIGNESLERTVEFERNVSNDVSDTGIDGDNTVCDDGDTRYEVSKKLAHLDYDNIDVPLRSQLALSSEEEDDDDNPTGEAGAQFWMKLATAGHDDSVKEETNKNVVEENSNISRDDDEIILNCEEDLFEEAEMQEEEEVKNPINIMKKCEVEKTGLQDTGIDIYSLGNTIYI